MTITRHTDPDAFLVAAEPLLVRNPAIRSFAWAVADGWRNDPAEFMREAYVATFARGTTTGLAVRRRGGPLLVENSSTEAARAFADDAPGSLRDIASVGGEREPCAAFAQRWDERFGTTHALGVHMRHHMLTHATAVPAVAGTYRMADGGDAQWLESRTLAFAHEVGLNDSPDALLDGMRKRLARGGLRIWEHGTRVAYAGWGTAGAQHARIAPVYTEPRARRRGYAGALVAALVHELLGNGRRAIFLLTDVANPTSNALYARIGFRSVSDTYRFDFRPSSSTAT